MGKFRVSTRLSMKTVAATALGLILSWYGLIAFARLQVSGYHEARERELRETGDALLVKADRLENQPRSGSRWMIMAADQRRDARMLRESADKQAQLRKKYLGGAMRPWAHVPPDPPEDR
jgi:hypothetical protein